MATGPIVTASFRRILVGWDGSPGAVSALYAAAAVEAAHVVALAVFRPAPYTEDVEENPADLIGRQRFVQETFTRACQSVPGAQRARVKLQIIEGGDPARAVCEYADQHGFDLLVLGRRCAALADRSCGRDRGPQDRPPASAHAVESCWPPVRALEWLADLVRPWQRSATW
jgi:nucleotide-binding universal stress UspA family protein